MSRSQGDKMTDDSPLASDESPYKYSTGNESGTDDKNETGGAAGIDPADVGVDLDLDDEPDDEPDEEPDREPDVEPDDVEEADEEDEEEQEKPGTAYRTDSLYVTEDTRISRVVDYLQACIENPIVYEGNIIWNFSTHRFDFGAFDVEKMDRDRFVVPYQVTGAWAFMFQLLPEEVKNAETLVYKNDESRYYAYRNFYRTTVDARREQIEFDLSRRLEQEMGEVLGLHE